MLQKFAEGIQSSDRNIEPALRAKIDNLTKPKGSLGRLEELAFQIGLVQQTLSPVLSSPCNIVFAADHGIVEEGVSLSPKEITWQQTLHFLEGGAGINFLCRQHGFRLIVVDAGVDYDFPVGCGIVDRKIRKGSTSYLHTAAMTHAELESCLAAGSEETGKAAESGCNVISFGEMGITNTSSSAIWMHYLAGIPLDKCVGAGSGLDNEGIKRKYGILKTACDNYSGDGSVADILRYFGGFEMVMAVGGMLEAARRHMVIIVDGFIMSACMLAAIRICPAVKDYAVFGHVGDEQGHRLLLDSMGAKPLLDLGLRLGEGSGAVCAYPILESAVRMINEMDSFAGTGITKYFK